MTDPSHSNTEIINLFIDVEYGFLDPTLTEKDGGSLYVPSGEEVSAPMGDIIANSRNTIFILSQDYHPATHISFMANHPGVMEYRIQKFKAFLKAHGQAEMIDEVLYQTAQQPVHFFNGFDQAPAEFPFEEMVLDSSRNIIGLKMPEDGRIRHVEVTTAAGSAPNENDRGRISKVLDSYETKTFDQLCADGVRLSTQTLWTKHCIQGTKSVHYPDDMNLPQTLISKLEGDLMSPTLYAKDDNGNKFYVIRKGNNSELDSYGIGVENDGKTLTPAFKVFANIAEKLEERGIEKVILNIGGLASNFCVEFSANNTADFLVGHFKMRGMEVAINFVPEISRGIPIPGGAEVPFSSDGVVDRLKQTRQINTITVSEIMMAQANTTTQKQIA